MADYEQGVFISYAWGGESKQVVNRIDQVLQAPGIRIIRDKRDLGKTPDPANLQGLREDMDLSDRIRDKVSSLTSILKDMNTLSPDEHRDSDFSHLYSVIEKWMRFGPATATRKESKPAEGTHPANHSIPFRGIQVGGNAGGNIRIGNQDQPDDE